jgi:hypothetical protein
MSDPALSAHRLLAATMTLVALLGWGAYAYSEESSGRRDEERLAAIARVTTDRDKLVLEQQRLVAAEQRLQRELALANAQLAASRDQLAMLQPQQKVATTSGLAMLEAADPSAQSVQKPPLAPPGRSKPAKRVASSR